MTLESALLKKAEAQQRHFILRFRERFDLKLSDERYRRLVTMVEESAPGTNFLHHQPPDKTVWILHTHGHVMRVVYDHTTARLVTCLLCDRDQPKPQLNRFKVRRERMSRFRSPNSHLRTPICK